MNKRIALLAAGMLLAASGIAAAAGVGGDFKGYPVVRVVVNGSEVRGEVPGINMDGNTLVPLRVVGEALGAKIGWDPATSTASVMSAAVQPAAPSSGKAEQPESREDAEKRKLVELVRGLYAEVGAYIGQLPVMREKIRIAKEFYDIKKSAQYFTAMNELYWKTFEDKYTALLTETSTEQFNRAKTTGVLDPELLKTIEAAHSAMSYYKYSVEHFNRYVSMNQTQFLDFYITSYASAFEEELQVKEQYAAALDKFKRANP
jgi:hypothetical protein